MFETTVCEPIVVCARVPKNAANSRTIVGFDAAAKRERQQLLADGCDEALRTAEQTPA